MILGVDVSSHQDPTRVDWDSLGATHGFVVARTAYGIRRDRAFAEHVRRARDAGLAVGGYSFFRAGQPELDQAEVFLEALDAAGCGAGWLVPAVDVERNEKYDGPFTRERYSVQVGSICRLLAERWGDALVYTSSWDWQALGSPSWLRHYLLWVAHWGVAAPRTPLGMQWSLWQCGVGPVVGSGYPGPLDKDVALELPLVRAPTEGRPGKPAAEHLAGLDVRVDWDEQRRARDEYLRAQDQDANPGEKN